MWSSHQVLVYASCARLLLSSVTLLTEASSLEQLLHGSNQAHTNSSVCDTEYYMGSIALQQSPGKELPVPESRWGHRGMSSAAFKTPPPDTAASYSLPGLTYGTERSTAVAHCYLRNLSGSMHGNYTSGIDLLHLAMIF